MIEPAARPGNFMLPGNPRYQPKSLIPYFGYDNLYRGVATVEIATLDTLGEIGVIPAQEMALLTPELRTALLDIPTTLVDEIERKITKHDIRAWVRCAQELMGPQLGRWAHIPLTSYDPLESGRSLQYLQAYREVSRPAMLRAIKVLAGLVQQFADTPQIGRTHGQAALPITVGFWLATILSRLIYNLQQADLSANGIVGKISGAVGAYNAQVGLGISSLCGDLPFEDRVLEKIGLKPARISTQILPPEPLAYFLFSLTMMSASLAQLGRDGRHLMRSEIGEFFEWFDTGQVGSSTMPHKRNPISWEGLEGAWIRLKNEFGKVLDTLISEHQRDLTASSVMRDFPAILVILQTQLETLLRPNNDGIPFLERVRIDKEACLRNLYREGNVILAEPFHIALQMAGYTGDGHELVNRKLVGAAKASGRSLVDHLEDLLPDDEALSEAWGSVPAEVKALLASPLSYTGLSQQKAMEIAEMALGL